MNVKNKKPEGPELGRIVKKIWKNSRVNILIIFIFFAVSVLCLHILQNRLLDNAQQTGQALSQSYSVEEERNINTYKMLISFGADYMTRELEKGADDEKLTQWISEFL